jgi:hypothetical protein
MNTQNERKKRAKHTSLESVFPLYNIVQDLVILASICVVDEVLEGMSRRSKRKIGDLTIAAHNACDACHDASKKWMGINFVLCSVINFRGRLRALVLLFAVIVCEQFIIGTAPKGQPTC